MNSTAELSPSPALGLPVSVSAEYCVRLATSLEDVRAAQRLRFEVFNVELGKGLDASYRSGLDQDAFDEVCDHILVFHAASGELAGTYRIQTGEAARLGLGYYSEQEFDFSPYAALRPQMIELGRACVQRRHRNLSALGLLWKAIAGYARERNGRYLIGCSSVSVEDPAEGWTLYAHLMRRHLAAPALQTVPLPGWACPAPTLPGGGSASIPKLMSAYFAMGAEICGAPAWDRHFGTVDFLTVLDLETLHPAARRRFFE